MLRAMALWGRDLRVVIPLAIFHLGQWGVYLHNTVIVREHWENMGGGEEGCQLLSVEYVWIQIQFIYGEFSNLSFVPLADDRFSSHGL